MKKISLFGATGLTGRQFLEQALAAGHEVVALVRNPAKLTVKSPLLTVIQGDVLDAQAVSRSLQGAELVVSLFGHVKGSPEGLQTKGTQNILAAMQQHQVERIISLSGGGLPFPEKDQPKFADHLIRAIMKIAVPKVLNDAIKHHQVLAASNRQWVIVRGPRLTNEPARGNYRVGWVGVNASTSVGRADLAHFILRLVNDTSFDKQMPFVSY